MLSACMCVWLLIIVRLIRCVYVCFRCLWLFVKRLVRPCVHSHHVLVCSFVWLCQSVCGFVGRSVGPQAGLPFPLLARLLCLLPSVCRFVCLYACVSTCLCVVRLYMCLWLPNVRCVYSSVVVGFWLKLLFVWCCAFGLNGIVQFAFVARQRGNPLGTHARLERLAANLVFWQFDPHRLFWFQMSGYCGVSAPICTPLH